MKTRDEFNSYMKARRAELKAKGICVDCQDKPVKQPEEKKKPHVCCESCLEARRARWKAKAPSLPFVGSMQLLGRPLGRPRPA
jgi:hypothetical protein